jgi:hypothetical protein
MPSGPGVRGAPVTYIRKNMSDFPYLLVDVAEVEQEEVFHFRTYFFSYITVFNSFFHTLSSSCEFVETRAKNPAL